MQTRIKEIVEETQDSPRNSKSNLAEVSSKKGLAWKPNDGQSYLHTVKNELENMCSEVLVLRETLRDEGARGDAMVNQKMSKFDEFRLSVLD